MVVLGDSLSDGGYYGFKLTNTGEDLWHEYLADRLGYERATTTLFGFNGLNLAISASLIDDLQRQVNRLGSRYNFQASDICTLWIGGNDIRGNPNQNMTPLADEIGDIIGQLHSIGIDHIIVPNLPDIGAIPENPSSGTRAERTAGTIAFNTALANELDARALTHSITIEQLDIFELFDGMLFYAADYGFENVTDTLQDSGSSQPDTYAFWDDIHPTTRGHFLVSSAAYAMLEPLAPIEVISQSIEADGALRQTWLADPGMTHEILSGAQVDAMNTVNAFLGSPAYTVEIAPPSATSGFFKTRK